jgi:predicted amidohydrolase YtcJ
MAAIDSSGTLVFQGGTVLTCDPAGPVTDAVAVSEGRVVAIGGAARALAVAAERVVDLGGRSLVPGFRDGHVHPLHGGDGLLGPPVLGARSVDELLERVRTWAGEHPDLSAVTGAGYDPPLAPGGHFDAAWLDRAVADRPVVLTATDGHACWANSAALAAAGIDSGTPDPDRGRIVRRPDGSPLGTLLEDAMRLVDPVRPEPTRAWLAEGTRRGLAELTKAGIVWAQDAMLHPGELERYLEVAAAGELTCRVNGALLADPAGWRDQLSFFEQARALADAEAPGLVSARSIKFFADGVIEAGTAALLEPYVDSGQTGIPNWTAAGLAEAVTAVDALGFQAHIHAIGDAGIRIALDAIAHTARVNGPRDRRPVIAHTQLVDPADLARFAELGVVANFEPIWDQPDPCMRELTIPRLGPERSGRQYPMYALAGSGARLSFGSDWPVSSVVPLEGIAIATAGPRAPGGQSGGGLPANRLSLDQALAAYTSGTAWQAFEDDVAGSITVGKRADLCVLSDDISGLSRAGPEPLASVQVDQTWLAGTEVGR